MHFVRITFCLLLSFISILSLVSAAGEGQNTPDFYFARLEYPMSHDDTWLKGWYTDFPTADENITILINRLTNIRAAHKVVKLVDKDLFSFPFIYIVEPEQMDLNPRQVARLHEYILRGGFLLMDDFHGDEDFIPVKKIFTATGMRLDEIGMDHKVFHSFYDIEELVQAVNDSLILCGTCNLYENGDSGKVPHVYGHYATNGNLDVVLLYNNDAGDGVEWLDNKKYPRQMSIFAVKMFINVFIYALSH